MPGWGLSGPARHVGTAITEESHHRRGVAFAATRVSCLNLVGKSDVTAVGCRALVVVTGDPGLAERPSRRRSFCQENSLGTMERLLFFVLPSRAPVGGVSPLDNS